MNPEAWQWGRTWTPSEGNGWIQGPKGTGKTHLARCMLNEQLYHLRSVGELSADVLVNKAAEFGQEKFFSAFASVYVLVFEDIDKTVWTPKGVERLWSMINKRYESQRRTIITGNVTPEQMATVLRKHSVNDSWVSSFLDRLVPTRRITLLGNSLREG